eukprot:Awhi_evm2s10618
MFDTFDSSVVGAIGYQYAIQSFTILYLLDVLSSLAYIHYHNEYTRSESHSSKSKGTSLAKRIKDSIHVNQSKSLKLVTETINEAEQEEITKKKKMVSIYDGDLDEMSKRDDGIDIDLAKYGTVYDGATNSHSDVVLNIERDLGDGNLTEVSLEDLC